jgi:hypothetical protein
MVKPCFIFKHLTINKLKRGSASIPNRKNIAGYENFSTLLPLTPKVFASQKRFSVTPTHFSFFPFTFYLFAGAIRVGADFRFEIGITPPPPSFLTAHC